MPDVAVVALGHGSRDAAANLAFLELTEALATRRPRTAFVPGFIELATPRLESALTEAAARSSRVVVLPAMLFAAGHVKTDVPLALEAARARHPGVVFEAARALGVEPTLAAQAFAHARAAFPEVAPADTTVVFVGRGSSDPDANGDFFKMARLVAEGRGLAHVEPCFMGITAPRVEAALERVAHQRPRAVVVVPYMLFSGRLVARLEALVTATAQRYPWVSMRLAAPLGVSPELLDCLEARLDAALSGAAPLPCDGCMYRRPLEGFAEQVGGLKALLYSVRHSVTHESSAPHVHAHRPLRKHVLVCTSGDCTERGSVALVEALRRELRACGLSREVRVTRTACLGRCGEGPAVVVYPDGVWYRNVTPDDARPVVREHLAADRLVAPLVDNIMQ